MDFLDKLKKLQGALALRPERREEMRAHLVSLMDALGDARSRPVDRLTPQRSLFEKIITLKRMPIFAVIVALAIAGGGTSLAAQGALPGDVLYPVKVNVNEEVRAAFAFGAEAKAEWAAERAAIRLTEAERLAVENKLDAETRVEAETSFERFAERAEARIESLPSEKKAALAARLEASLQAHALVFANVEAQASSSATADTAPLKAKARAILERIQSVRATAEAEVGTAVAGPRVEAAAKAHIEVAARTIIAVEKFLQNRGGTMSAEAKADAEVKLATAKRLESEARAKFEAQAYTEAFRLANEAVRTAHTIRVKTRTESQIKIEVRPLPVEIGGNASSGAGADGRACIQVITPAKNPATGEVRNFPTPCDVPPDWQVMPFSTSIDGRGGVQVDLGL